VRRRARLTRRELIAGTAAAALAAGGIYELIDHVKGSPADASPPPLPREQHELAGLTVVEDEGVEVVVPPLHHEVVTAVVSVGDEREALLAAQEAMEEVLRSLDRTVALTVAWGLPYFRRYVPALAERHLPIDRRASTSLERPARALQDAIRFPSDPIDTILEDNDVAVLLRGDNRRAVEAAGTELFAELEDVFTVTSIRKGFVGGGFAGGRGLPKRMAQAAGVPGADLVPETAELFLGFTSTQKAGLGPARIANLETLGYTDAAAGYFAGGTHMHLSHIFENLEAWYLNFDFRERVDTTFRPGLDVRQGAQTVRQGPEDVVTAGEVERDFRNHGRIGHSAALQSTSRLQQDFVGDDGTVYPKGTAIPQRADFNTLDNPFFWSSSPVRDGMAETPAAGVHFVVFNPSSDDFARNRLAMDGRLPDGTRLPFPPRARGQGLNSILRTTHRQNFLVPPTAHRSFPLVELLP
jgi:hypothetical protein